MKAKYTIEVEIDFEHPHSPESERIKSSPFSLFVQHGELTALSGNSPTVFDTTVANFIVQQMQNQLNYSPAIGTIRIKHTNDLPENALNLNDLSNDDWKMLSEMMRNRRLPKSVFVFDGLNSRIVEIHDDYNILKNLLQQYVVALPHQLTVYLIEMIKLGHIKINSDYSHIFTIGHLFSTENTMNSDEWINLLRSRLVKS